MFKIYRGYTKITLSDIYDNSSNNNSRHADCTDVGGASGQHRRYLGESQSAHAGYIQQNPAHFDSGGGSHGGGRSVVDELLEKRQDGGRIAGMAKTYRHHMDYTE